MVLMFQVKATMSRQAAGLKQCQRLRGVARRQGTLELGEPMADFGGRCQIVHGFGVVSGMVTGASFPPLRGRWQGWGIAGWPSGVRMLSFF
jgi:hypothetical protein